MKTGKRRIVISIITAFVMAFAVIPYMGNSQVNAASDPYIQEYTSSQSTPITQIKFIPDGNGTFGIEVTVDYEVYNMDQWQTIEGMALQVRDTDSGKYYLNMITSASGGRGTFTWGSANAKIVPGSNIFVLFQFGEDIYTDYPLTSVSWKGIYTTAPLLKSTSFCYPDLLENFKTNSVAGIGTMLFVDEAACKTLYDENGLVWGYEGTNPVLFSSDHVEWKIVDKIPAAGTAPVVKEVVSATSFETAAKYAGKYVTAVLVNSDGVGVVHSPYILITDKMANYTEVEWQGNKAYNYREQVNSYPIFKSKVKDQSGRYLEKSGFQQEYTISFSPVDVIDEDEHYVYPGTYKATIKFNKSDKTTHTTTWYIVPAKTTNMKANLVAKSGGYNDVKLSWKKPEGGCDGYGIWQKAGADGTWKLITHTKNTSITLNDRTAGTKYSYKVKAYINTSAGKKYSNTFSATVNVTTLKKVVLKSAFYKKDGKAQVRWNNIDGETGYQISKSTSKNGTNIVVKDYKTTTGNAYKVSATKGKTYYYKVRAYKVVNGAKVYGPWSAAKAFVR